jgi:hypothetical protein
MRKLFLLHRLFSRNGIKFCKLDYSNPRVMSTFTEVPPADHHIFSPKLWPGIQTITRSWHFKLFDGSTGRRENPHKINFRHCQATGNWVLIVDGRYQVSGCEPVLTREFDVSFNFGGKPCAIYADGTASLYYEHQLVIDGVPIEALHKKVDISLGERTPQKIRIPKFRTYREMSKLVVVYMIEITDGFGDEMLIERRYSDFAYLDSCIRAATEGHMYYSLPTIPGKVYNPWVDQSSNEFIEERRQGLESYMSMLWGNGKVTYYTDFFVFLGLNPLTGQHDSTPTMMFRYPPS